MKRIILLLITITTFTNISYASFPVVEKVSFQTTEQTEPSLESITNNRLGILSNCVIFTNWSTYSLKKKVLICLILLVISFGLAQLAIVTIGPFFVTLLYNSTMN